MAKRKSINRGLRQSSRHRSSDSMNSALLDPDTDIVGEGRTFWWNNLEESTPPRYSRLYSRNETARQLNGNSQIDSTQSPPEWWKNLETSNSKHLASTKHNFSAGIVKSNILQISTSESEKESECNLKKVQLKATKRKSINNAFLKALDDTETAVNTIETNSLNLSPPNIEKAISNANEIVVSSHASDESIEIPSERTFWCNNLEESTPLRYSWLYSRNETARQLNENLQIDSTQSPPVWWKNLETSNSKHAASTKHNFSAGIVKRNILQISTSESEKESERNLKKVQLKAMKRKSINNAFLKALDDTETAVNTVETNSLNLSPPSIEKAISNANEIVVSFHASDESIEIPSGAHKSTDLRLEMESSNDEDAEPARQTIQQNSTLLEAGTSSKTINQQSIQNSNRASIREGREIARKVGTSVGTRKSTSLKLEMESSDDEDAEPARETIQQDSISMEVGTSSKTINRQSIQNSNRTSIREGREITCKVRTSVGTRKSTSLRLEMESSDDEDAEPARETIQQDSTSMEAGTSSKTINRQSIQNSNRTSIREGGEIARKVGTRKSTGLKLEMESSDDEDAEPARETIQQDFTSMEAGTSSKTINRQSIQNSNRTSIREGREIARKVGTSVETRKSTSLRLEMESSDDEDAEPARQTIQQDSTLMEAGTSSKTINRQSIQNSNRTSIGEGREIARKVGTSVGTHKSTSLRLEMESSDDEDAEPARQTIQQDSTLMEAGTSSKTINRQSIQNSNRTSIGEGREIARKVGTSVGTHKSTSLRLEMESSDDEDAEPARQTIQQDSALMKAGTSSKTINRQSIQNSNRTSIGEGREIARKVGTSVGTHKSTSLRLEMESSDDEDAEPARQTIQQDSTLIEAGTSSKTINRHSIQNPNRTSIGEAREIAHKVGTSVGTRKSTSLRLEMESSDDEDAEPARQTIQQDSTSMEAGTSSSKTINRQSIQNSNRTSIRESKELVRKQKSNLFKSLRKIDDFFKVKQTPTTLEHSNGRVQKSQVFEKIEKIKTELEKIKTREMAAMHIVTDKKKFPLKKKDMKFVKNLKQATKMKPLVNHTKVVNKAFLINGKVYRAPRLPRPKYWATDRLYKFLWNHMEPNYKLATRVKSEKFVQVLAKTVAIIERRKNYEIYKAEVNALMREMARLNIINTRNDFYHFCQEFMPYEFRIKVVPMLMPGNKNNIPYNSELLHVPLLDVIHKK
ncbi:uncharacterized protein LOC105196842 isoform X2 [Solenopsis invicta]|uniref:uncharacterized protein LOC105196842 isoform X2 n=1 Tax=Solenopsis invicta TaxID=13686 RepID=UPI00193C89A3|nr:uncharacterized protein LOC105196842 isoform X2 [Solenopsis invicta]